MIWCCANLLSCPSVVFVFCRWRVQLSDRYSLLALVWPLFITRNFIGKQCLVICGENWSPKLSKNDFRHISFWSQILTAYVTNFRNTYIPGSPLTISMCTTDVPSSHLTRFAAVYHLILASCVWYKRLLSLYDSLHFVVTICNWVSPVWLSAAWWVYYNKGAALYDMLFL